MDLVKLKGDMVTKGMARHDAEKEASFALQIRSENKRLAQCTPESFMKAVINIANIGLSLNPAKKEAYLIPRYNRSTGQYEAALEPSYIGLIRLACVGNVKNIVSNVVHKNDEFKLNLASNNTDVAIHYPAISERGLPIAVYAIAFFDNGTSQIEFMDIDEINVIRDQSEGYLAYKNGKIKTCPWVEWYQEMARKVVIKRLCKYLPGDNDKLSSAIDLDNEDYRASLGQLNLIESLLQSPYLMLPEEETEQIEDELFGSNMARSRASYLINRLKSSQAENVVEFNGGGSTQKELDAAIQNRLEREK